MSLNRAVSLFTVKAVDDEARTITGIASTPETDRSGDVVMPKGGTMKLPLPFLWQHDAHQPIGNVVSAKATDKGIEIVAQIAKGVSDEIDKAWALIKAGLVRGLSIGFRAIDTEQIPNSWGVIFKEWELLEVSAVTVAANASATIQTIKSLDRQARGASAQTVARLPPAGVTAKPAAGIVRLATSTPPEGTKMNVQKQIESWTAARQAKSAVIAGLMDASEKSGESLTADQEKEYDDAKQEIATIDKHLARLNESAALMAGTAVRLPAASADGDTPQQIAEKQARIDQDAARGGHQRVIAVEKKLPPGIAFARFAKTMVMANGNARDAIEIAKERYPNETPLHNIIKMHIGQGRSSQFIEKAAVDAALTTNSAWAGALVQYQDMANDFIEFLRPQTILGRIPGLRMVPFKVRVPRQTGGGSAFWVGQGAGKPLTALAFDNVTLEFTKIATIAVLTDEVVRLSTPNAETITRDQLAQAIIQQMDADFIDPDNAGTANVKPASITNGVTGIASSGNAEANVRQDILAVFQPWIVNNVTPANAVWIMSATTALALSLMVNSLGQPSFPGLNMTGGTFQGLPVIVSESAGVVNGSAGGHIVVLLNARDIMVADDGTVAVDASREASLEMSDAPANNSGTATGASLVSMFQTNSVAIRAERWVNWVKARPTAVQFLKSVNWGEA